MTVVLYDAMNLFFKGYYTANREIPNAGVANAISHILSYAEDISADEYILCGESTTPLRRKQIYPMYKGTRKAPDETIIREKRKFIEVIPKLGIPFIYRDGYEGDDIIGTLARRYYNKGWNVIIISGDRDLLQLVNDRTTVLLLKSKDFPVLMTPDAFYEQYGFPVESFIDFKALCGDSSDNIPGCRGIGYKTAMFLIGKYGSIDNYVNHYEAEDYKQIELIRENRMEIDMSLILSTIDCRIPDLETLPDKETLTDRDTVEYTLREIGNYDLYNTYHGSKMYNDHILINHM